MSGPGKRCTVARRKNTGEEIDIIDLNGGYSGGRETETPKRKKEKKKDNREFAIVKYTFVVLFCCLAGYFCYFLAFQSEDFINSTYNARVSTFSSNVIRGDIKTADGTVVATSSLDSENNETRSYPEGSVYAHAIGYAINGMSGVELDANFMLLRSHIFFPLRIWNEIQGKKNQGDTVVTTLDATLQKAAYERLSGYDGAVIAIEPSTGKILAMVSEPSFDPNTLASDWDSYTSEDSKSSVLINRATQGLYPPGSTFKIVTLLEYLSEGGSISDTFSCKGSYTYDNYTVHCYHNEVHGTVTLDQAFAESCNISFAQIGLTLDREKYLSLADQLLFNQALPTQLSNVKQSSFDVSDDTSDTLLMQTAFGQGDTLVTPIHEAMIAASIANGGVCMEPYLIDHTENNEGKTLRTFSSKKYGAIMTEDQAGELSSYMRKVVTDGTASALATDSYTAYGKTGTAEYSTDKDQAHSWFTGYAEKDGKQIAIAVIMEGAGSGSRYAVPLAKSVFDTYFSE